MAGRGVGQGRDSPRIPHWPGPRVFGRSSSLFRQRHIASPGYPGRRREHPPRSGRYVGPVRRLPRQERDHPAAGVRERWGVCGPGHDDRFPRLGGIVRPGGRACASERRGAARWRPGAGGPSPGDRGGRCNDRWQRGRIRRDVGRRAGGAGAGCPTHVVDHAVRPGTGGNLPRHSRTTPHDPPRGRGCARRAPGVGAVRPGTRIHLYAPIIVKYRDASTDAATALEEALR